MYRVIARYVARLPGAVKEGMRLTEPFPACPHGYPAPGRAHRYPQGSGTPWHHNGTTTQIHGKRRRATKKSASQDVPI